MNKRIISQRIQIIIGSALIYFALDYAIGISGSFNFGSYIGLKNFLPPVLGLVFGPWGALGGILGCTAAEILLGTPFNLMAIEYMCIAIPGVICWYVWHLGSKTHKVHFKKIINYMKYLMLLLVSYIICGGIAGLALGNINVFLTILISYVSLGLLVGIPVLIILNSVLCIEPVIPAYVKDSGNDLVTGTLTKDSLTLDIFNEALEDYSVMQKINRKKVFELQSCIEELYIRIIEKFPETDITCEVHYDGSYSAKLTYPGVPANVLLSRKKSGDDFSDLGIRIIKHNSLRASYKYSYGENHIHIVI